MEIGVRQNPGNQSFSKWSTEGKEKGNKDKKEDRQENQRKEEVIDKAVQNKASEETYDREKDESLCGESQREGA